MNTFLDKSNLYNLQVILFLIQIPYWTVIKNWINNVINIFDLLKFMFRIWQNKVNYVINHIIFKYHISTFRNFIDKCFFLFICLALLAKFGIVFISLFTCCVMNKEVNYLVYFVGLYLNLRGSYLLHLLKFFYF